MRWKRSTLVSTMFKDLLLTRLRKGYLPQYHLKGKLSQADEIRYNQNSSSKQKNTILYSTMQEAKTMKGKKHEKRYRGNIFHLIELVIYLVYSDVDFNRT